MDDEAVVPLQLANPALDASRRRCVGVLVRMWEISAKERVPIPATNSSPLYSPHSAADADNLMPRIEVFKGIAGSARVRRGSLSNLFFERFSMAFSMSRGIHPGDDAEPTPGSVKEPEVIGVCIALVHSQCQLWRN
jgi:hypothetical protein